MSLTELNYLAACGDLEEFRILIQNSSRSSHYLFGLFGFASKYWSIEFIRILIEFSVDINIQTTKDGDTFLHTAAFLQNIASMKLVCEKKANINIKNKRGYTPLHTTAEIGFEDGVILLLNNGADANITNNDDLLAEDLACKFGHTNIVDLIWSHRLKNIKGARK